MGLLDDDAAPPPPPAIAPRSQQPTAETASLSKKALRRARQRQYQARYLAKLKASGQSQDDRAIEGASAGRPRRFIPTEEITSVICGWVAAGKSLASLCLRPDLPPLHTVMQWATDPGKFPMFAEAYGRACAAAAEALAHRTIAEAENATAETSQLLKARTDARMRIAGGFNRARWGDRFQYDPNAKILHEHVIHVAPAWITQRVGQAVAKLTSRTQPQHEPETQGLVLDNDAATPQTSK